jgi:hypothetical protein
VYVNMCVSVQYLKKRWIIVYKCVTGVYVYRVDEGLIYSIFNF